MSTPMITTRRVSASRLSLGMLVAGLLLAVLGVGLALAPGGQAGEVRGEEAARTMLVYRAGEWLAARPAVEQPSGWATYRTGEHAPLVTVEQPSGWATYRTGEHAP